MKITKPFFIALSLVSLTACAELDRILQVDQGDDGSIGVRTTVEVPLLPIDLPIFPTSLTMDGFKDGVKSYSEDKLGISNIPRIPGVFDVLAVFDSNLTAMEQKLGTSLEEASAEIMQPGTLNQSIQQTFSAFDRVEVVQAGMELVMSNGTDSLVSVPAAFEFYIGDQTKVAEFDVSTRIPFQLQDKDENNYPVIKPGDKNVSMLVEDIPALTELLNKYLKGEEISWGMGFRNLYRMADTTRGADTQKGISVFAECSIALAGNSALNSALKVSKEKSCPKVEELTKWHLTVHQMKLKLVLRTSLFKIPGVPSCEDYANGQDLPYLEKACGEVKKDTVTD